MRPSDVLAHRRILLERAREMEREFRYQVSDVGGYSDDYVKAIDMIEALMDCECYFVTSDMSAVAIAAGRTMPSQNLKRSDLPSERGILIYDQSVATFTLEGVEAEYPIRGVVWAVESRISYEVGCCEEESCEHGSGEMLVRLEPLIEHPETSLLLPASWPGSPIEWPFESEDPSEPLTINNFAGEAPEFDKILFATWTLMQQSLSVSERINADRAERRRSQKVNLPSEILVVRLRRLSIDAENDNREGSPGSWSHRWIVNGHWRNQWLPSRGAHRLQWISPYVKGPESKPLVIKDRISAWVR